MGKAETRGALLICSGTGSYWAILIRGGAASQLTAPVPTAQSAACRQDALPVRPCPNMFGSMWKFCNSLYEYVLDSKHY